MTATKFREGNGMPEPVRSYLSRRGASGCWQLEGACGEGFDGAVVIPSLAESPTLFSTLESLDRIPPEFTARYLVVVVVNNRPDAPEADKADNAATLERLRREGPLHQLNLAWVDAATPERQLPLKHGGVGMARKIGLDLALPRLSYRERDPLLICLDGDTAVRSDYLHAIERHFSRTCSGGAVIPFRHQPGETDGEQRAIDRYELFLRSYVLGLHLAGSPYAFHTVGSAMACRASAYVKMGGMNTRSAGEDFYFLQQLYRTSGVTGVAGTVVYPSPRPSHRVPFGTGRSVSRLLAEDPTAVLFYDSRCYRILGQWLAAAAESRHLGGEELYGRVTKISPELARFLHGMDLAEVWDRLRRNHPSAVPFAKAFHDWFDGLKTMKLVHHISDSVWPRQEPHEVFPPLLRWGGLAEVHGVAEQLELLRDLQQCENFIP